MSGQTFIVGVLTSQDEEEAWWTQEFMKSKWSLGSRGKSVDLPAPQVCDLSGNIVNHTGGMPRRTPVSLLQAVTGIKRHPPHGLAMASLGGYLFLINDVNPSPLATYSLLIKIYNGGFQIEALLSAAVVLKEGQFYPPGTTNSIWT